MNYDKLEALVKEKGVSKTFLCQIVGRERYYLRDCKKNNFIPPDDHIAAWADALGTTADYLTDKTNQKEKPADLPADAIELNSMLLRMTDEQIARLKDLAKDILGE